MRLDLRAAEPTSTRTVDRALALLSVVGEHGPVSLTEAARRSGLPASTALRHLRTLEAAGFVVRADAGRFSAGPRLLQLGATALGRSTLVRLAEPALERIVAATGESAYLVVRGPGGTAVYIAMVEGTRSIRHTSWVGRSVPLEGLAVGLALAGDVGPAGYAAQRDRFEPDLTAIAAPVRRPGGVAAALNVLGPTYRIDGDAIERFGQILDREARALGAALGVTPSRRPTALTPTEEEVSR
ncbi:Urocanate hydratase (fragment) [Nostocoides japonicum T1-X7]|uniref:Urocanate hydratase n=1 Tax=Nostocoides japonicum T1-X7 TaxID=1194083 RepID=A0A077M111_9MICO